MNTNIIKQIYQKKNKMKYKNIKIIIILIENIENSIYINNIVKYGDNSDETIRIYQMHFLIK